MSSGKILVVDNDRNLIELLKMRLESANYDVVAALIEEDAVEAVKQEVFDLSIVDLQLVHRDGISLMGDLHLISPEMPIIILTAYGSIQSAVEAMKKGAYNYLTKPFDTRDLLLQIEKALENRRLTSEIKRLKGLLEERYEFTNIVAKSEKMRAVLDVVHRIARTESTINIYGESGTGKELIAKAIHLASERKTKPFVPINCSAIPEALMESELFGHKKGAFTEAVRNTKGLLAQAHEGTIFLDEIGDMPSKIQVKLLRFLQEKQFYPVGSEEPMEVDIRVIAASQKDLAGQVHQGLFREDLFYRINVIPIHLPPLRERKEDIPLLVKHFLKKFSQELEKEVKGLTPEAMLRLMLYEWPGNVRELENVIEYSAVMTPQDVIVEDLILQKKAVVPSHEQITSLKEARGAFEKGYLTHLLDLSRGNVTKAAGLAGKHRADLYELLKKHHINIADYKKCQ
jgi:two-component system, NtrC family, response regulator GlrR